MLGSESNFHVHIYFANHSSSQLDLDFITSYIANEQAAGRYSEPFHPKDLEHLIGPFHTSPLCNGGAVNIRLRTAYVIITIYIPRWDYTQFRSLTLELPTSSNPNAILFVLVCLFGLVLDVRASFHFF